MKFNLTLSALFVLGLAAGCNKNNNNPPPTTPADVDLKKGLLLFLPFDGNMADSSGNGNLTTPVGGAALTYDEHGYAQSAFGGTGNGEKILVTNNGSIKFDTAYSLSYNFMVRVNNGISRQAFVTMLNDETSLGVSFVSGIPTSGSEFLEFTTIDSNSNCNDNGHSTGLNNVSSVTPEPESWYNVVNIFHKGVSQIFVNGKLVATQTDPIPKAFYCPNSQVIIGGWWKTDPITINGKIDEVRLYNRVLNADEITELSKDFQLN